MVRNHINNAPSRGERLRVNFNKFLTITKSIFREEINRKGNLKFYPKPSISDIQILAGSGIPGDQLLLLQQTLVAKAEGVHEQDIQKSKGLNQKAFEILKKYTNSDELKIQMTKYITEISKGDTDGPENMTEEEYVNLQVTTILSPWMINFLRYNRQKFWKK